MATHTLDLGVSDVHQASPMGVEQGFTQGKKKQMADPKTLPSSAFALPAERKYRLDDAETVQASETALEQDRKSGAVDDAKYGQAKRRVARAARKHGVASKYAAKSKKGGIAVRAHIAPGGELHVRHMSELGSITCRIPYAIADHAAAAGEPGKPVWIQLAKTGHFKGHRQGVFDLNARVFEELIRNFKDVDGGKVAFDFEHFSELPPEKRANVQGQAEAQGIIHDLKSQGTGLFALVEWLEPARSLILAKKYWAVSPAINFAALHPETGSKIGARLTSAALTNGPFLRGMRDVIAASARSADDVAKNGAGDVEVFHELTSEENAALLAGMAATPQAYTSHEFMPRLRSALKQSELATPKDLSDQLGRLRDNFEAAGGNASAMHQGIRLSDYMLPLRDLAAGGNMSATWDQVFDAVENLIDAAMDEHEVEYNGGVTATDDPEGIQELTMAEKDLAVELGQTKSELSTAQGQVATLTLTANGATTKAATLETELATANAELKTLRDKVASFEEHRLTERVEVAMADHKASQKLTEEHRPMMLLTLKSDPVTFEKIYPKVRAEHRHLTSRITPPAPRTEPTRFGPKGALTTGAEEDEGTATTLTELTEQLMASSNMSYEEAANQAAVLFSGG